MKKNSGMSTMIITGMAAFVSVFTLILLIVIKGAFTTENSSTQYLEAEEKANKIAAAVEAEFARADINVVWNPAIQACIFAGKTQYVLIYSENKSIYRIECQYSESAKVDSERLAEAQSQAAAILATEPTEEAAQIKATASTIAPQVFRFAIDCRDATLDAEDAAKNQATLSITIEFTDANKKKNYCEKIYNPRYTDGVKSWRYSQHQGE